MPVKRSQTSANSTPVKDWSMILFESLSVGITTILILVGVALFAIGIYVSIIWPLTSWEGINVHLAAYRPTLKFLVLTVFMIASFVGFWFISGAAWAGKAKRSQVDSRR